MSDARTVNKLLTAVDELLASGLEARPWRGIVHNLAQQLRAEQAEVERLRAENARLTVKLDAEHGRLLFEHQRALSAEAERDDAILDAPEPKGADNAR